MGWEGRTSPPPKKPLRVKINNNTVNLLKFLTVHKDFNPLILWRGGDQLPPTSLRVNPIFNPMKGSKLIRLITFDPGLVFSKNLLKKLFVKKSGQKLFFASNNC